MDAAAARRARVFAITWLCYASYYLTRKHFAVAKTTLETTLGLSTVALGDIETGYFAAYAGGQLLWGLIGDRAGWRPLLVGGMAASALCSFGLGASHHGGAIAILFALNGLAQSTGWPACVKAMGAFFAPRRRGTVMGAWSTCYQVGSLAGNPVAAAFLTLGLTAAFVGPGAIVLAVGLLAIALPARAPDGGEAPRLDRRGLGALLATPRVWLLGGAYFFLKLTRYVLLFWLPYYMERTLGYPRWLAATLPLTFEVGGMIGSITVGALSDRVAGGRRFGVTLWCLSGLAGALPLYARCAPLGPVPNALALALVGFLLFGPDTLISGAAAQDLGGAAGAATAAGVINGFGSLGPIAQGRLTAAVSRRAGFGAWVALLGVGALVAALLIAPAWWRERRGATPARGGGGSPAPPRSRG